MSKGFETVKHCPSRLSYFDLSLSHGLYTTRVTISETATISVFICNIIEQGSNQINKKLYWSMWKFEKPPKSQWNNPKTHKQTQNWQSPNNAIHLDSNMHRSYIKKASLQTNSDNVDFAISVIFISSKKQDITPTNMASEPSKLNKMSTREPAEA